MIFANTEGAWLFFIHYFAGSLIMYFMTNYINKKPWRKLNSNDSSFLAFLVMCSWMGVIVMIGVKMFDWLIESFEKL